MKKILSKKDFLLVQSANEPKTWMMHVMTRMMMLISSYGYCNCGLGAYRAGKAIG
jgi:hypothetical protein